MVDEPGSEQTANIMLPKVERRELQLPPSAVSAFEQAQDAVDRAIAHRDALLLGIVSGAGILQATVIEVRRNILVVDVSMNGHG